MEVGKQRPFGCEGKVLAQEVAAVSEEKMAPVHPGEVLLEEFLKLGLQAQHDLDVEEGEFGDRLERDVKVYEEVYEEVY